MYEQFTERARRAMVAAQEEAARHGAEYVSTEHELLGLVDDDNNMASRLLDRMGADHRQVRAEVDALLCHICMDNGDIQRLTPLGARVLTLAREEAQGLGEPYVGTGHLLLGLIREEDGLASRTLARFGATLGDARAELRSLHANGIGEEAYEG